MLSRRRRSGGAKEMREKGGGGGAGGGGGGGQASRFRTERAPKVLSGAFVELVLVHKQDVVLETRVEMRFETQVAYDGVVVAVDVGVDSVEPLEELAQGGRKMLGKGDADDGREGGFVGE